MKAPLMATLVCQHCAIPLIMYNISFEECIYMCSQCLFPLDSDQLCSYIVHKDSAHKRPFSEAFDDQTIHQKEPSQKRKADINTVTKNINPSTQVVTTNISEAVIDLERDSILPIQKQATLNTASTSTSSSSLPQLTDKNWHQSVDSEILDQLKSKIESLSSSKTLFEHRNNEQFGNIKIQGHFLQAFLPRRWISESGVDLYCKLLHVKYSSLGYFPPEFAHSLSNNSVILNSSSKVNIQNCCRQLREGEIDSIVLPIHVSDYWIVAVISGVGSVYIFDPFVDIKPLREILSKLKRWVQLNFDEIEWEFEFLLKSISQRIQIDKFDSAVFCCLFFDLFGQSLTNADFSDPFTKIIASLRDYVFINHSNCSGKNNDKPTVDLTATSENAKPAIPVKKPTKAKARITTPKRKTKAKAKPKAKESSTEKPADTATITPPTSTITNTDNTTTNNNHVNTVQSKVNLVNQYRLLMIHRIVSVFQIKIDTQLPHASSRLTPLTSQPTLMLDHEPNLISNLFSGLDDDDDPANSADAMLVGIDDDLQSILGI